MKTELTCFRKLKDLNDTPEQIISVLISVQEHRQKIVCVTVSVSYDCNNTISAIDFREYSLIAAEHISASCIGKAFCEINRDVLVITDIGIEPPYRSMGYGTLLMKEILKYIRCVKVNRICGKVFHEDIAEDSDKERFYRFYQKYGFDIIDDKRIYLKLK